MLGGVVSSIGMVMFVFSSTFYHCMAAQLVFGLGTALISPSLASIAAIEGRRYGSGTTMSALESAMSLGMMAGPLSFRGASRLVQHAPHLLGRLGYILLRHHRLLYAAGQKLYPPIC